MRQVVQLTFAMILALLALSPNTSAEVPMTNTTAISGLSSTPLTFTENKGQWSDQVLFRTNAGGATMWFCKDGAYYQFLRRTSHGESGGESDDLGEFNDLTLEPEKIEYLMIKASFLGANPDPQLVGMEALEYKCNYFIGNDPAGWRTNVPSFRAIIYQDIYPGIDLKYFGNSTQMEYDFIVSPGANPLPIKIRYDGAESLSINSLGNW